MFTIKKLNKISTAADTVLGKNYVFCDDNPDGILVRSFDMKNYPVGDRLLAVARAGAGINNLPVKEFTERGIAVFNTPGANANAVKELTLLAIFLTCRNAIEANKWVNTLIDDVKLSAEKGKSDFCGSELSGKTVGVVGMGAIGSLVSEACALLGAHVLGCDPRMEKGERYYRGAEITPFENLISKADIITLHLPLNGNTCGIIDKNAVKKFKKGAILINMSRGELVDTETVKEGLADGKIAKYVVDFPEESILRTENIIVFPHLGASTAEAEVNCAKMAAEELKEYLENGNVINSVNFPDLSAERKGKRTCVFLREEFADILPKNAFKASKNGYVYAIIDGEIKLDKNKIIKIRYIN